MTIYNHIPYFYIIKDVVTEMYYAGAKWGKDANPHNLMKKSGYITSSETIKKIVEENGVDRFIVVKIKTFQTAEQAKDYETRFLQKVDAKNHSRFYNKHNNDSLFTYHDEFYKKAMVENYGVEHPQHSITLKNKLKETNLERYGTENVLSKNSKIRLQMEKNFFETHSVINPSQLAETQEKIKNTSMKNRGVEHHSSDPAVKQRKVKTMEFKYGVKNAFQISAIQDEIKVKKLEKYGSINNIEKIKETNLKKYGVDNVGHVPEIAKKRGESVSKTKQSKQWRETKETFKKNLSNTLNSKEWVETKGQRKAKLLREHALNRPKLTCPHCHKKVDSGNYARWHGDKCKLKT